MKNVFLSFFVVALSYGSATSQTLEAYQDSLTAVALKTLDYKASQLYCSNFDIFEKLFPLYGDPQKNKLEILLLKMDLKRNKKFLRKIKKAQRSIVRLRSYDNSY